MQLYAPHKKPSYFISNVSEKAFLIAILTKYGVPFQSPKIRPPFYVSFESCLPDVEPRMPYIAGAFTKANTGHLKPLKNLEDDLVLEARPCVVLNACTLEATTYIPPDNRMSRVRIFKTRDDRTFEVYETKSRDMLGAFMMSVTLRSASYFHSYSLEPLKGVTLIDYLEPPQENQNEI